MGEEEEEEEEEARRSSGPRWQSSPRGGRGEAATEIRCSK